jgi:hypothetical protein
VNVALRPHIPLPQNRFAIATIVVKTGMENWVDIIVKLTPAFITLVVGLIASLVAYLQYKANRDKLRLDLFSKRLEAFEKLQDYLRDVLGEGRVTNKGLSLLAEARAKSRFLFGPEIESYFDELWRKACELRGFHDQLYGLNALPIGPERNQICELDGTLVKWKTKQLVDSPKIYAKYMMFNY